MFLVLGCVWVGMTVLSICLQVANQYVNKSERGNVNYNDWQITVVVCGHFIVNLVYMAIALNYCTQCQLLIHYVQYILLCIQERSLELKRVMQVSALIQEGSSSKNFSILGCIQIETICESSKWANGYGYVLMSIFSSELVSFWYS